MSSVLPLSTAHSQAQAQETNAWATLVGDLLRLARIYRARLDHRRMFRCEGALKSLETALREHGTSRGLALRRLLSDARARGLAESEDLEMVQEAAAWWGACGASYHLSLRVSLEGTNPRLALRLSDLHCALREVIGCVYPDEAGQSLIQSATDPDRLPLGNAEPMVSLPAFREWMQTTFPGALGPGTTLPMAS